MKTLLLVDGSSYLYRAFHALARANLRNRKGEPTGAIHGVVNMLRRLLKETPAEYGTCVFDANGKTFRDKIYPEYKANRPPMPDDLVAQLGPLKETIAAMGWPLLEIEGVEADDVIGTLARQAERQGLRVIIASGDKDLTQLVNPVITIENADPGTGGREILDEAGVAKKFGVKPERIIDYLTLIGDSVDNVPGVADVGPVTAVKWLAEYGTLDNLVAHSGEIDGKRGENLRKALDWLPQARELLTLKSDVKLPVKVGDLAIRPRDTAKLSELSDRLDFKSLRRELEAANGGQPPAISETPQSLVTGHPSRSYETILTEKQLES